MCRVSKWFWGLLPVLLIAFFAINHKTKQIEADLSVRSAEILKTNGVIWANVAINGRDAIVRGTAPSEDARQKVMAIVDSVRGVRKVHSEAQILAVQSPYTLSIVKDETSATISGYAPNDAVKLAVVDAVKSGLPGINVLDKQALAGGAPVDSVWVLGTRFAAQQLAKLTTGTASFVNTKISIEGVAAQSAGVAAVLEATKTSLPQGISLDKLAIVPPTIKPYNFDAMLDEKGVTLSGFYPSEDVRVALLEKAKAISPNGMVIDQLQLGAGAPSQFLAMASVALEQLKGLTSGGFGLVDSKLSFTGLAKSGDVIAAIKTALSSFGVDVSGLKLLEAPKVEVAAPAVIAPALTPAKQKCQAHLNDLLAKNTIQFNTGSAVLRADSVPFVNQIAGVVAGCDLDMLTITGHTDNMGAPAMNLALSEARAMAVVHYLVSRGIEAKRLKAIGKGEEVPVATNFTVEGRQRNRRIEFTVK